MKQILKRVLIFFCCAAIFFGASYAYLNYNFNKQTAEADQKQYTVPYERKTENQSIVFIFANNSALLVHLDFDNTAIRLLNIDEYNGAAELYGGYTVDYTVNVSYSLIEGIIDRVGGINLEQNGEVMRYVGAQAVDLISQGCDDKLKRQIISEIFGQMAINGFTKDDIVYIADNSETDLSVVDSIYWVDRIKEMSTRVYFIN